MDTGFQGFFCFDTSPKTLKALSSSDLTNFKIFENFSTFLAFGDDRGGLD
jgi:hypothetical protein